MAENRFETLYHISTVLNSSLDLDNVLQAVMDQLIELTHAERGFLCFVDPHNGELSFPVARNVEQQTLVAPEFEVSRTLVRKVVDSRNGELLLSAVDDPRFERAKSIVAKGMRSVVCVPLMARDRVLGVVYVDNHLHVGVFKKEDLEILTAFANIAASALDNARLYGEVRSNMQEILTMKSYQDAVFESVDSGILAVDSNSTVTVFNQSAERIFGLQRAQVLRRPVREALHGRAADVFGDILQEVTDSGHPVLNRTHSGHFVGGGYVELRVGATPLRDAGGTQIGATMIVDDISSLLRLEAERNWQESEKLRLKQTLGKFVSEEVAHLAEQGLSREGTTRRVSILFSDLVGFTTRAERLAPDRVIGMLNFYFGEMGAVVARNHGTIKQFVGDEIMVLYNAVRDVQDHPLYAFWTAIDMVDRLRQLAAEDPAGERGFYDVKIGVHSGDVVVGGVGTEERMEFAAVGDNVNLCSRIMNLNPQLGTRILISEEIYREVNKKTPKDVVFKPRGDHMVKGRETQIRVYEVIRQSWEEDELAAPSVPEP